MAVPDFQTLMRPTLTTLVDREPHSLQQIRDAVADSLRISEEDQAGLLPSGRQTRYSNRVAWALTHMGKAGLVERFARGQYLLTDRGNEVLDQNPERVDMAVLSTFPSYLTFRESKAQITEATGSSSPATVEVSPSEAVGNLIGRADEELAAELLERVLAQPPAFLERLALPSAASDGLRRS